MTLLIPKPVIIRDPKHLRMVRQLPCCLSLHTHGVEAHHLLRVPGHEKCMGRKSGDNWCIPLRCDLHRKLHDGRDDERVFLANYDMNGVELAKQLWALTEQGLEADEWLEEGRRIVEDG